MIRASLRGDRRRAGFTLIELLVVLAIIGVLVSLSAVAVFRLIGTQQNANTKSELSRLEAAFKKAYRSAADNYAKEPIPVAASYQSAYNTILNQAGNDRLRAQVIWTKLRLRRAFPMTFNEAVNPLDGNPVPPLPYYTNTLAPLGYTALPLTVNPTPAATSPESSACLLLALQRGEDGPGLKQTDLGPSAFFQSLPVKLQSGQNGQPVPAIVDGWGNPLFFVRWPIYVNGSNPQNPNNYGLTGLPVPNPPGPAFNDADDPTGLLASTSWQYTAGFTWFTTNFHDLAPHPSGPPQTYKNFPIIASGGSNNQLGFNPYAITLAGSSVQSIDADDLLATLAPPQ